MKKVLTIAGSDCSGGAGIQADLKTMSAHKIYGMSVITALTAQNTQGVFAVSDCSPEFVAKQIDCIFTDIIPDAVKIGMVSNIEIIKVIAQKLKDYNAKNIVLDPVMISTSGSKLLSDDAVQTLINTLMPLASIVTPNIAEAEVLSGLKITNSEDMQNSAVIISENLKADILIKGGHSQDNADDLIFSNNKHFWVRGERVNNPNTHGTGCTLSSAIACNLALGNNSRDSVINAKNYITKALEAGLDLGKGSGPLKHCI